VRLRSQPRRTPTPRSQHRRRRKRSRLFAHGTCGRSQRLESRTGAALAKAFRFAPVGLGRYRLRNASDLERLRVRQADDADGAAAFPSLPESACSAGASCACRFLVRTRSTRSPSNTCARTHAPTHGSAHLHSLTPPTVSRTSSHRFADALYCSGLPVRTTDNGLQPSVIPNEAVRVLALPLDRASSGECTTSTLPYGSERPASAPPRCAAAPAIMMPSQ
jgi:hypothetical protein